MSYLGSFLRPLTFATLPHTIVAIAATALMLPRRRYLNRKDNKNMRRVTHRDGVEYHWVGTKQDTRSNHVSLDCTLRVRVV